MLQIAKFTFSPIQENTYVLYTEAGEAALVDPGCYFDTEKKELGEFIESKKLQVQYLLQTHCHLDHVFGLQWAADTFGLQPHMHPQEEMVLQWGPASATMWNLPFDCYTGPFHPLAGGQKLLLGKEALQVLFTPGHSPGHVCFYHPAQQVVIAGDVLFEGSIGRTDLPGGHMPTLLQSIQQQLMVLPDATIVHPGHGPATTIGEERKSNPFLQ